MMVFSSFYNQKNHQPAQLTVVLRKLFGGAILPFTVLPRSPIFGLLRGVLHCACQKREEGRGKGRDGDVAAYAAVLPAILSLKRTSATQSFLKRLDFYSPPFNLVSISTCICWRDSHCGSCFLFNRRIPIKSIYHLTLTRRCRFEILGYRWFD